jgi:IS5 family transposase
MRRPSSVRGGGPPFLTEVMVRILLIQLQNLFNWSDEQMEFLLLNRLSFQRFMRFVDTSCLSDRHGRRRTVRQDRHDANRSGSPSSECMQRQGMSASTMKRARAVMAYTAS